MGEDRGVQQVPGDVSHRSTIVGREREQYSIAVIIDQLRAGRGALVLITGEAGLGKTTLVNWAVDYAREPNVDVLSSHCHPVATPPPFGPWLQFIRQYASNEQVPSIPVELREGSRTDIESRSGLFDSIDRFLNLVAERSPLVLILEDIQWADESTVQLLLEVAAKLSARQILIIATCRDDEITPEHPLFSCMTVLSRARQSRRISLQQLDSSAIRDLTRQFCVLQPDDEKRLIGHLDRQTGGNPFFVVELLQMLKDQRTLYADEGTWQFETFDAFDVPSLVNQVITGRLSALDRQTRELLETAAVVGQDIPIETLRRVYDGADSQLDTAVQKAIEHRILSLDSGGGILRFRHELIRQAVYNAILPLRRRSIHRQLGTELAARPNPDVEAIAEHFVRAGDEAALKWLSRAAERAHQLHAPEAVRTRAMKAIDLGRQLDIDTPVEIYRFLGLALETMGDLDGADDALSQALARAKEQSLDRAIWQAQLDLGSCWAARDYQQSLDYVTLALSKAREIDEPDLIAESLNRLGNCFVNFERFDEGIAAHQDALQIFEQLNSEHGIVATLDLIGLAHVLSGNPEEAISFFDRAIPGLRRLNQRRTLGTVLATSAVAQFGAEHALYDTTLQHRSPDDYAFRYLRINEALAITRDMGWSAGESFCLALRSRIGLIFGEFDVALTDAQTGAEIGRQVGHRQWQVLNLCSMGMLCRELLDLDRAEHAFHEAYQLAGAAGSPFMTGLTTACLASTCVARGELNRAESLILPRIDLSTPPVSSTQRNFWYVMIELSHARSDHNRAIELLDQLEDTITGTLLHRPPQMSLLRASLHAANGELPEAIALLEDAEEVSEQFGYLPVRRNCLTTLCDILNQHGRTNETLRYANTVTDLNRLLAERLSAVDSALSNRFLMKATAALSERPERKTGQRPNSGGVVLTRREGEVLQMVARGLTDAEVSEGLYISPRTVSQHLRSIYSKLKVNNRTAAVRVATDQSLFDTSTE